MKTEKYQKRMQFKEYVWLPKFDTESIYEYAKTQDDWSSVVFESKIEPHVTYSLMREDINSFHLNHTSKDLFLNRLASLGEEYSVLVKDGLICFVSLDYTIKSQCFHSFTIPESGRFDLKITKVHDTYFSYEISNTKEKATGFVFYDEFSSSFKIILDKECRLGNLSINIISTLLSECVTQ